MNNIYASCAVHREYDVFINFLRTNNMVCDPFYQALTPLITINEDNLTRDGILPSIDLFVVLQRLGFASITEAIRRQNIVTNFTGEREGPIPRISFRGILDCIRNHSLNERSALGYDDVLRVMHPTPYSYDHTLSVVNTSIPVSKHSIVKSVSLRENIRIQPVKVRLLLFSLKNILIEMTHWRYYHYLHS